MLVFVVLAVRLGVRHHALTYNALEGEGLHGGLLLRVSIVAALLEGRLLGLVTLLRLRLLMSTSHGYLVM